MHEKRRYILTSVDCNLGDSRRAETTASLLQFVVFISLPFIITELLSLILIKVLLSRVIVYILCYLNFVVTSSPENFSVFR